MYKVAVYAIAKDEEKFVERWVDSMKEADSIYVLDTGSSDKTFEKLKSLGVHVVKKIITPWRFDVARDESLKLVPDDVDICVCTDLDEVFNKGWREKLEQAWEKDTTRAMYHYNWSFDKYNKPLVSFLIEKIHSRKNYKWTHPVHEVLKCLDKEKRIVIENITLSHYPDITKSRSSYLPLLELSVKEDPLDDRNMHYLGREYMFYQMYEKSIETLKKHLKLKTATWKDERCASMRFIARCYMNLNNYKLANIWYKKAIMEAPYLRDAYVEMAFLKYLEKNDKQILYYCNEALKITSKYESYTHEPFSWNHTIYDLKSIAYYNLNEKYAALENINIALTYDPENERLKKNKHQVEKEIIYNN